MGKMSKWNKKVTAAEEAAVRKAMKEQEQNQRNYREVPTGTYPVVVDKMEVGKSNWGSDQINITFKITEGDYKNSKIYFNGGLSGRKVPTGLLTGDGKDEWVTDYEYTARVLSQLLDEEVSADKITVILSKADDGMDEIIDFIADAAEECESFGYDLDYEIRLSNKINPNTGKPYKNMYYTIVEVFDM